MAVSLDEKTSGINSQVSTEGSKEDISSATLTRSVGRGAFLQISGSAVQSIIRIAASTILARQLAPADFGLFGMAMLGREFITNLGALGMGTGIIAKKEATEEDLCTCFWTMASVRVLMFIIAYAAAPMFGIFFADNRVTSVVRAISATFLLSILGLIPYVTLRKKFKFAAITSIEVFSIVVETAVAIYLVFNVWDNYWSLVIAMIASSATQNIFLFIAGGWFPKFKFSNKSFTYLFRFGINGLGLSTLEYIQQNIDYILVGKLLGPNSLGLYEYAYRIPHIFHDRIAAPIKGVVFPALSSVQHDDYLIAAGYVKTVHYIALITFPALGGLAAIAGLAVPVLWGPQWLSIVTPLQVLCVCSAIRCTVDSLRAVFNCKDRPDIPFKFSLVSLSFTFLSVGGLGYMYNVNGVAAGMLISTLPSFYLLQLAFRMMQVPLKMVLKALWPVVACTGIVMITAHISRLALMQCALPPWTVLLGAIIAGAASYGLSLVVLFPKIVSGIFDTISVVVGRPRAVKVN